MASTWAGCYPANLTRDRALRPAKAYRDRYRHIPLSPHEAIPWSAHRLIVGTGVAGQLPITPELNLKAERQRIEIVAQPTPEACRLLQVADPTDVAAILYVTC